MTATPLPHAAEHIALFLSKDDRAYRPLRLCEIVKALKYHKGYCGKLLKKLVEYGVIAECIEFDATLYYCPKRYTELPMRDNECTKRHTESSPFHKNRVQENINSNKKKKRKKRDSNFSRDSQAEVSTPPGEAGQAVGQVYNAHNPTAPDVFLPADETAVAVAPETHQKIYYDVFKIQTGQAQPDRRVAAPAQSTTTTPQIDWLQRLLAQSQNVAVHGIFFNLPKIGLLSTGKKEYS